MTNHEYGGPWTEIKEQAIRKYLEAYTKALKNKSFNLIYIDAFAGTGERNVKVGNSLGILDSDQINFDGSPKIALNTTHPFSKYIFIDDKSKHIKELEELIKKHPDKNCKIEEGDANEIVQRICRQINWKRNRAVLFLDPFGMDVDWETLVIIANTKAIDVWYLVSITGLFRNMPRDLSNINDDKKNKLRKMFGEAVWESEIFYKQDRQINFLDEDPKYSRESGTIQFDKYVAKRLNDIFSYVEQPIHIPATGLHKFSLYFALSNDKPAAINLAKRIAKSITEKLLKSPL